MLGWAVATAVGLAWGGCDKSKQIALTDTEGRAFQAVCKGSGCTLESTDARAQPSATKPEGAEAKFVLRQASRLMAVCEVWQQGSSHAINPADCRALTCESDAQCPLAKGLSRGVCTNGLCIEPSAQITSEDAVLLCLAGTGRPSGTTKQVERYALGNSCGNPCHVPAVCRQP